MNTVEDTGSIAAGKQPNIIFILSDNLGYGELGVYGGGVLRGAPTPRLDTLATVVLPGDGPSRSNTHSMRTLT
jgi:hypothetical protein